MKVIPNNIYRKLFPAIFCNCVPEGNDHLHVGGSPVPARLVTILTSEYMTVKIPPSPKCADNQGVSLVEIF